MEEVRKKRKYFFQWFLFNIKDNKVQIKSSSAFEPQEYQVVLYILL